MWGNAVTAMPLVAKQYTTKDGSCIRELLHPSFMPGLGLSLAEAVVNAGESTKRHFHMTFDEIYYCLEGAGVLYINDISHPFFPGAYHLLPKGSSHYLAATTRLRLLCVCCPGYAHEETVISAL